MLNIFRDVRAKYSTAAIRLFILSAHYRSPLSFSEETLIQATGASERLRNGWVEISFALSRRPCDRLPCHTDENLRRAIADAKSLFDECMCDDFNTTEAISPSGSSSLLFGTNLIRCSL